MDKFYTSLPLAEYFLPHGTHVTGIVRDNRHFQHFPTKLKSLAVDKGAAAFYQHDELMIAKYRALKDRVSEKPKIVCVLSTAHTSAMGKPTKEIEKAILSRNKHAYFPTTKIWEELT